MSATPTAPTIDGYADLVRIGRGGLGDVYRAVQTSTGAPVAIKVLRDVSDSSIAWHRTRRELTALLALSGHANVVQIVELLELPQGPALVMEYAPGGSVADLMRDRGTTLTVDEAVFVGRSTAAALVSTHAREIVHRDIKPQNLLIVAGGQVKLCDFGIAALMSDEQYRVRTNAVSMRYASPEDLEHDDDVGPPSDVYSLGATLLHLVRGAPPTLRERLAPWEPPQTADAHLAALDRVMARCLHPTPTMRPTAQALLDALDGLALGAGAGRVTALPVVHRDPPADLDPPTGEVAGDAGAPERAAPRVERWVDDADRDADPDAPTVTRPRSTGGAFDRVEPVAIPRPEPDPPKRPHRRRAIVLGALLILAIIAAVLLWLSERADAPGPSSQATPPTTTPPTTTTTVAPTTTLPPGPQVVARPPGLADIDDSTIDWRVGVVGDCLVQVPDNLQLAVAACDQPHDLQRFAVGQLDESNVGSVFDADAVAAQVTESCDTAFESFVGTAPADSALDIAQTRPDEDAWANGDRAYHCYLGVAGSRVIGDARTSGW